MPASLATWRCKANAPAVITPSKTLTASGEHWRRGKNGRGIVSGPPSDRRGFLGLLQGPLNRTAPPAGGGGGGGSVTGPISLSRDIASAAGGAVIIVTAAAIVGTPVIVVNGEAAAVTPIDGTHCSFVVPAVAGVVALTTVPVVVGGVSAPNQFQLAPAYTSLLWSSNFEDGTLGPFETDVTANGSVANSTAQSFSGTHSALCKVTLAGSGGDNEAYLQTPGVQPSSFANGFWWRFYILIPTLTLANNGGQVKVHLLRRPDNAGQSWSVLGYGASFGSTPTNALVMQRDSDTSVITKTPITFGDAVWREILLQNIFNGTTGTVNLWVGGLFQGGQTNNALVGDNLTNHHARAGIAFADSALTGDLQIFLDNCTGADGCVDPQNV